MRNGAWGGTDRAVEPLADAAAARLADINAASRCVDPGAPKPAASVKGGVGPDVTAAATDADDGGWGGALLGGADAGTDGPPPGANSNFGAPSDSTASAAARPRSAASSSSSLAASPRASCVGAPTVVPVDGCIAPA